MTKRRDFLRTLGAAGAAGVVAARAAAGAPAPTGVDDRAYWLGALRRIAEPVLSNLAEQRLKEKMPVETAPGAGDRRDYSHLEACGRLLAGISPWLELQSKTTDEEGRLRDRYADLARRSLDAATDPRSRDRLNFTRGGQPLVDAAFLAHAILRAPGELWQKLDQKTRANVAAALKSTRVIVPNFSNWLLFSATVEAALCATGQDWDRVRVDYAVRQHEQWYKGDGTYGDGPEFHWDYYNSFVIQPMLLDVLRAVSESMPSLRDFNERVLMRARRYAAVQERLISPEGTFPAVGRSLAYRFGAFQLLGQVALIGRLPEEVAPAQVRCALSTVIRRMVEAPGTFDREGWLTIGFCGHQPTVGEPYISTGSLYLCSAGLLPLGLPPEDPFWSAPPADWTAKRIWSGQDVSADHALR